MLSVIIPCHNEEENIRRFETELCPSLQSLGMLYEVILVDDGSTDGSAEAMKVLSAYPSIKVLSHGSNRGMGAALRTGFAQAKGQWIMTLDADLTFHPSQIAQLLAHQKETWADMVSGSPLLTPEGLAKVSWTRRLPSAVINGLYRLLFSRRLTSYTTIFRLYRASLLKAMRLVSNGFELNAEIAVRFVKNHRKLEEIPAVLSTREQGYSKLNRWRELKNHLVLMLRLRRF
ncbi:MAG: glycosyltransferase family 2 protein [Elusimicrobia bacterium]|nr:glycosyltransferase family 2 protein [Elusimicrobiota bacterium]